MKSSVGRSLVWAVVLLTGVPIIGQSAVAANCALYARAETGVYLYGDAGGWWGEAARRYQRGHAPKVGSILVFKRSRHMPSGHVAIVAAIIGPDEVLVDQANWRRGTVSHGTPVIDTSPDGDWTTVAVMNLRSRTWGRDNPTWGFVYPETGPRDIADNRDSDGAGD